MICNIICHSLCVFEGIETKIGDLLKILQTGKWLASRFKPSRCICLWSPRSYFPMLKVRSFVGQNSKTLPLNKEFSSSLLCSPNIEPFPSSSWCGWGPNPHQELKPPMIISVFYSKLHGLVKCKRLYDINVNMITFWSNRKRISRKESFHTVKIKVLNFQISRNSCRAFVHLLLLNP